MPCSMASTRLAGAHIPRLLRLSWHLSLSCRENTGIRGNLVGQPLNFLLNEVAAINSWVSCHLRGPTDYRVLFLAKPYNKAFPMCFPKKGKGLAVPLSKLRLCRTKPNKVHAAVVANHSTQPGSQQHAMVKTLATKIPPTLTARKKWNPKWNSRGHPPLPIPC